MPVQSRFSRRLAIFAIVLWPGSEALVAAGAVVLLQAHEYRPVAGDADLHAL